MICQKDYGVNGLMLRGLGRIDQVGERFAEDSKESCPLDAGRYDF